MSVHRLEQVVVTSVYAGYMTRPHLLLDMNEQGAFNKQLDKVTVLVNCSYQLFN